MPKVTRKNKIKRLKKSFQKYKGDVKQRNKEAEFKDFPLYKFIQSNYNISPNYSELINYINRTKDAFADQTMSFVSNNFKLPKVFSLSENYIETSNFLRKFFNALYFESYEDINIDYSACLQIDVCASMCMDIILSEFISYYQSVNKRGKRTNVKRIQPINFDKYDINKMLFSIGAYRNIRHFKIDYEHIVDFPIITGSKNSRKLHLQRDVDITKTVDHIIKCLGKMNKTLTGKAETNFYKVIGEVLQNSEEHSSTTKRYSIGYFEKVSNEKAEFGIFNLSILNFGRTYYESFKTNPEANSEVLKQMKTLSGKYTKRFIKLKFEEETLWTLYALQDGVTSKKDWNRGNGAIRFIESFFELRGSLDDNISKLVIISGHTLIKFDGKYSITEKINSKGDKYKVMTFNMSGNIEDSPDPLYVRYEENYFPGTLISAKIKIDNEITENINLV